MMNGEILDEMATLFAVYTTKTMEKLRRWGVHHTQKTQVHALAKATLESVAHRELMGPQKDEYRMNNAVMMEGETKPTWRKRYT